MKISIVQISSVPVILDRTKERRMDFIIPGFAANWTFLKLALLQEFLRFLHQ